MLAFPRPFSVPSVISCSPYLYLQSTTSDRDPLKTIGEILFAKPRTQRSNPPGASHQLSSAIFRKSSFSDSYSPR